MPEDQRAEVETLIPRYLPANELIGEMPDALKRRTEVRGDQ